MRIHHSNIPHFTLVSILILNTAEGPGPFSGPWQNYLREDFFILLLTEDGYNKLPCPKGVRFKPEYMDLPASALASTTHCCLLCVFCDKKIHLFLK